MQIKKAEANDLLALSAFINENIIDISKCDSSEYRNKLENEGYLMGGVDDKFLEKFIGKIYLAFSDDNQIIGYIRIEEGHDEDFVRRNVTDGIIWIDEKFKTEYLREPHFELGGLLVSRDFANQGIGQQLYKTVEAEAIRLQRRNIFSFVATNPIPNKPSLHFHKKNGFKVVAELKKTELYGLKDYQSVLLVKSIS